MDWSRDAGMNQTIALLETGQDHPEMKIGPLLSWGREATAVEDVLDEILLEPGIFQELYQDME